MFRYEDRELKFLFELEVLLVDAVSVDKYSIYLWRDDASYLANLSKLNLLIRVYDGEFPAIAERNEILLKDLQHRIIRYLMTVERGANRVSEDVGHEPDAVLARRLQWKASDLFKLFIELSCTVVLKNEIESGRWPQESEAKSRERTHQIAIIIPRLKEKMSLYAREVLALLELTESIPLSPQQVVMIYAELFEKYDERIRKSDFDLFQKLKVAATKDDLFVMTEHLTKLCRFACSPQVKSGKSELEIITSLLDGIRASQLKLAGGKLFSKSVSSESLIAKAGASEKVLKRSM